MGFSHVYKSRDNNAVSSKRVKVADFIVRSWCGVNIGDCDVSSRHTEVGNNEMRGVKQCKRRVKRKRRRDRKKSLRLDQIKGIPVCEKKALSVESLNCERCYFSSDDSVEIVERHESGVSVFNVVDSTVVNTVNGAKMYDNLGDLIFLLVPRRVALENCSERNVNSDIDILQSLQRHTNHTRRGIRSQGTMTSKSAPKYISVGVKACRGRRGTNCGVFKNDPVMKTRLVKFMRRLEHFVGRYIDSDILRGLQAAKRVCRWETIDNKNLFYSALASAADYYSAAHVDADFFFSLLYTIVDNLSSGDDMQGQAHRGYDLDDEVVQYFVFPNTGVSVALRPGDVLLFNPIKYHCLSTKTSAYQQKHVYVTSLYLKTAIVGGNDNTKQLNGEEGAVYDCMEQFAKK